MADLLNFGESNNAPLPVPGGYGNPTGVNPGGFSARSSPNRTALGPTAFPTYPAFAPLNANVPKARGNVTAGIMPSPTGLTTPAANQGAFTGTNIQGLSSGLYNSLTGQPGNPGDALYKELTGAYGKGTGAALFQLLVNGTFNPQVAAAFLNSMQPGISRGEADIQGAFGDAGSRFSSSAALGLGDYLSQVNLNEQSTLASLYEQGQQQELSLLQNVLPTLHAEHANSGGILGDILGGLEVAGGLAGAPFTGGLSLGLVGSGVGAILGANNQGGGSGGGGNSQAGLGQLLQKIYAQVQANNAATSVGGGGASSTSGASVNLEGGGIGAGANFPYAGDIQSISAGSTLGGEDPFGGSDFSGSGQDQLFQMLEQLGINPASLALNPSVG